jgi:hypothetical protein
MQLLTENDGVRNEALGCINNALSSCDDRIILALDELETLDLRASAEILAIENSNPVKLRELGLQMMRLEEVRRIACDHKKTLTWIDEIEIQLAFLIGVRQELDLPGSTQHMIFRRYAQVSEQDITNAIERVKNHCSEANLKGYLAEWEPWQKYQRKQAVPSFDRLESKMVAHINDCAISTYKTDKIVELGNAHFDYEVLVKAYLEKGRNPLTNTPLDWADVVRITKEASSPKKRRLNDP